MRRSLGCALVAGVAGGVVQLGGSLMAFAAPSATEMTTTVPMHIVGFVPSVAAAHGYRVITLSNGTQAAVPAIGAIRSGADPSQVEPENTVSADCGSSWITLSGAHLQYIVTTGFTVNRAAVDYTWHVNVVGPGSYSNTIPFGGGLWWRHSWSSGNRAVPVDDSGWYDAAVVQPSYAILDNGGMCQSLDPSSRAFVS
jgi:hypothetical protein